MCNSRIRLKTPFFYNCMENITPLLYAIVYTIVSSMENLRFDKEGCFHVLVTGYLWKM